MKQHFQEFVCKCENYHHDVQIWDMLEKKNSDILKKTHLTEQPGPVWC